MVFEQFNRALPAERATQSFRAHGGAKLSALCDAIGFGAEKERALGLFDLLLQGWGEEPIGREPGWRSDITDDHSPYEFSLACDGDHLELRFLIEAQKYPMDLRAGWEAALAACERLHRELGTPLERLRAVEDLFVPENQAARFSLWHAVGLRPGDAPDIKVYLNPAARAPGAEPALIGEALRRLGFAGAWRYLTEAVLRRADRLSYFSLDLSAHDAARVKIYLAHPGVTAEHIERLMAADPGYAPGVATAFCRAMLGGEGPFEGKPVLTCHAFTAGSDGRPHSTTLHLPIRDYVDDDLRAAHRILEYLGPARRPTFQAALSALAGRPLEAGVGLIQWSSFKRRAGQNRLTFYLSPEVYAAVPPRSSRAARRDSATR